MGAKILKVLWWLFAIILGFYLTLGFNLLILFNMVERDKLFPIPIYDMAAENTSPWSDFDIVDMQTQKKINLNEIEEPIIFVNFWATWCKPCIAEMPSIQILKDKFKNKAVKFMLISYENPDKIKGFMQKQNSTLPFYNVDKNSLPNALSGNSLPRTYIFVNQEVLYKHTGSADWSRKEIVSKLNYYLKEIE